MQSVCVEKRERKKKKEISIVVSLFAQDRGQGACSLGTMSMQEDVYSSGKLH